MRLLVNSIVTSALQGWTEEFRGLKMVEMRGLVKFVGSESDSGAIEVKEFMEFEEAYRKKAV